MNAPTMFPGVIFPLFLTGTTSACHGILSDLRQAGFPVWSRRMSCQGTINSTEGWVNVPVLMGGACITDLWVSPCSDGGGNRRGAKHAVFRDTTYRKLAPLLRGRQT